MLPRFVILSIVLSTTSALGQEGPQQTSVPRPVAIQSAPTVAGKWRMSIVFDDSPRAAGLELEQHGGKVRGRLIASFAGGEVPIEGEFADGKLTFSGATTGGPHPGMQLDFSATLKNDDSLAGTMSWQVGDFAWTAERISG
jgi:hypothetical protein